jgi:hypothetical protein
MYQEPLGGIARPSVLAAAVFSTMYPHFCTLSGYVVENIVDKGIEIAFQNRHTYRDEDQHSLLPQPYFNRVFFVPDSGEEKTYAYRSVGGATTPTECGASSAHCPSRRTHSACKDATCIAPKTPS